MDLPFDLKDLDGFAGFAALVNSLFLWPVIRSLQAAVAALRQDVQALKKPASRPQPRKPRGPTSVRRPRPKSAVRR